MDRTSNAVALTKINKVRPSDSGLIITRDREMRMAIRNPNAHPRVASFIAFDAIIPNMSLRWAPNAILKPISEVLCVTM